MVVFISLRKPGGQPCDPEPPGTLADDKAGPVELGTEGLVLTWFCRHFELSWVLLSSSYWKCICSEIHV